MGFNISGIAVDKNYENNFEDLQREFGWNLEKQSEIDFETASSNWKDEGICDVYFSDQGTLLFINMDMCTGPWHLKGSETLTFALSETSMAFSLIYCENGVVKRSIMEVEGERMQDEGEKLEVEGRSEDTSEIIWNQMEAVLGKKFWEIDPGEKATRYIFSTNKAIIIEDQEPAYNLDKPIPKEAFTKFSDADLFDHFDTLIKFAQENRVNAFVFPWAHKEHSRKFMNLFAVVTEILNRPALSGQITKRMPLERFKMLCKFDPEKVDQDTHKKMLQELDKINSKSPVNSTEDHSTEKKWWQFWK